MENRISEVRKSRGYSQRAFADLAGIHVTSLNRLENGKSEFRPFRAEQFAQLLECKPEDLYVIPAGRFARIVSYVGGGQEVIPLDADDIDEPVFVHTTREVEGVKVRGDSMWPAYQDGDIIIYEKDSGTDPFSLVGRHVVARLTDGRTFIKELRRGSERGRWNLISLAAPPIENVDLDWVAPVRFVSKR